MPVDTSILIRTLQPHHRLYASADRAIRLLPQRGVSLYIVAQNLIELWAVVSRPTGENGLGHDAIGRSFGARTDQGHVSLPARDSGDLPSLGSSRQTA